MPDEDKSNETTVNDQVLRDIIIEHRGYHGTETTRMPEPPTEGDKKED